MRTIATIEGIHCRSCKILIEDVCGDMVGVQSCNLDLETGGMVIEHDERFDQNRFKTEIEELGKYTVNINS